MPEELENTAEEEERQHEDELPEKYRGKTAAEIARMHMELETKLGQMGQELGQLRAMVQHVQQPREQASVSDYAERRWSEVADELLVNPEKAVRRLADEIRREVLTEAYKVSTSQLSAREQLEAFFRANPDLDKFREVVAVIGERVYQSNPHLPFSEVLRLTADEARRYIASLKARLTDVKDAKRAAATTPGSSSTRTESGAPAGAEPSAGGRQDEVLEAIRELHDWRKKRMTPPR